MSKIIFRGAYRDYRVTDEQKAREEIGSANIISNFLIPLFERYGIAKGARVLDVGCGVGETVRHLRDAGYDAYGLEPGGRFDDVAQDLRDFVFQQYSNDFYPESKFDFVMSFGVIEHVGTSDGHGVLGPDYRKQRMEFVRSIIRLTQPSGLLLISGPNRLFPFDFSHTGHHYGPLDLIRKICPKLDRLTVPWHSRNYLCSFGDIAELADGTIKMRVPQGNLLAMTVIAGRPKLQAVFRLYIKIVDSLPSWTWSFLHTHTLFLARLQ